MGLIRAASQCLEKIFQPGHRYAKAEVMLSDIQPNTYVQQSLFENGDKKKSMVIMKTMDELNAKLGRGTVHLGAEGIAKPWDMKRDRITKAFTTRWEDLPSVV